MTGSASDEKELQDHVQPKRAREALGSRFKDPKDPLRLVLVRDMWLTGFDADGHATYNVRSLTGPSEHFPVEEVHVTGKLDEHWAYWLPPGGGVPLGLTPMFRLEYRAEIGRKELLVPRNLELTPGKKIELCQLIGSHTDKFDVPSR